MAETANPEQSKFAPGEKYPLLGVSVKIENPWVRFGLPVVTGLAIVFVIWLFA